MTVKKKVKTMTIQKLERCGLCTGLNGHYEGCKKATPTTNKIIDHLLDVTASPRTNDVPDPVNNPSHYCTGRVEVIDFLEDQQFDYHLGNVVKYICRHKHKGKPLEDLQKARWYLDRKIAMLEVERLST